MITLREPAYAKLNLTLDILSKRDDGYHEIESIMQQITLCDDVEIDVETGEDWRLECNWEDIPTNSDNLAWKAAGVFYQSIGKDPQGITIRITKRIPMEAGLAGGSADAAAVIVALDSLLNTRLTQEQLQAMLLPIGDYAKDEVRAIAEKIDGFVAKKGDSQDICFIPDGDYAAFIEREGGYKGKPGDFVDMNGKVVGKHKGLVHYTVGQRKGLGLSLGKPVFVYGVDVEKNQVRLCDNQDLFQTKLYAGDLAHMAYEKFEDGMRFQAKIRYAHKAAWCTVKMLDEDILEVTFDEPQRAITPGQSLVLYDGEYVAGGGFVLPENAVKNK